VPRSEGEKVNALPVPFTARVKVPSHVLVQEVGGESVLLNLQNERYFGLDEVGTRIWSALTKEETIQSAYETLLREYEVEAEVLQSDIEELVQKLLENGLVETVGE